MPRILIPLSLIPLLLTACRPADAITEPAEQSPYTLTDDGALHVRPDLLPHLQIASAGADARAASIDGFGRVDFAPNASYALRAPFDGFIERVHVQPGQHVEQGQLLATLRAGEAARQRADLRRVQTQQAAERTSLARAERLLKEGAGAEREVVEARARLAAIDAELRGLRDALSAAQSLQGSGDRVELRARQSGHILTRHVEPGSRVSPGDESPAFVIGDLNRLVAIASYPERAASALRDGAPCAVTIPPLIQTPITGAVQRVQRAVDPQRRTVSVVCGLPADERLRSGMALKMRVEAAGERLPTIPRSALLLRQDDYVVLVQREPGVLERRAVVPGQRMGDAIQLLSGVAPGEQIVAQGAVLLDGALDQLR